MTRCSSRTKTNPAEPTFHDELITAKEAARRLGIERTTFHRLQKKLVAAGLCEVRLTPRGPRKYSAASIMKMIAMAINSGEPILR